jgi:hypothetical protein
MKYIKLSILLILIATPVFADMLTYEGSSMETSAEIVRQQQIADDKLKVDRAVLRQSAINKLVVLGLTKDEISTLTRG